MKYPPKPSAPAQDVRESELRERIEDAQAIRRAMNGSVGYQIARAIAFCVAVLGAIVVVALLVD